MRTNGKLFAGLTAALIICGVPAAPAAPDPDNAGKSSKDRNENGSDSWPNNWYVGLSGDLTWPNNADMGGGGNIDLGYRFAPNDMGNFRLEAEAGYHQADGENGVGDLRYFTYMGNVYYDFSNMESWSGRNWQIAPYIGAGAGLASLRRGSGDFIDTFHHHTNVWAYQGMAGLTFTSESMPSTEWLLGYRYIGTGSDDGLQLNASNLELGIRFHF